jgi:hypothetical protein
MTTGHPPEGDPPHPRPPDRDPPDPAALARDWMTLVQTELAGLAQDREALETWTAMASAWGRAMAGFTPPGAPLGSPPARYPAAAPSHDPTRAAPAAASPGDGGAGADDVSARLDALERRLAGIERLLERIERRGRGRGNKPG